MEVEPRGLGSTKLYGFRTGSESKPDYARTVAALSRADLQDELDLGRGSPEYREAVERELRARRQA